MALRQPPTHGSLDAYAHALMVYMIPAAASSLVFAGVSALTSVVGLSRTKYEKTYYKSLFVQMPNELGRHERDGARSILS
jgi:hypothetical protein